MLIEELLPHIDDTYPTVAGAHSMLPVRFELSRALSCAAVITESVIDIAVKNTLYGR
jgi:hypothetical protein